VPRKSPCCALTFLVWEKRDGRRVAYKTCIALVEKGPADLKRSRRSVYPTSSTSITAPIETCVNIRNLMLQTSSFLTEWEHSSGTTYRYIARDQLFSSTGEKNGKRRAGKTVFQEKSSLRFKSIQNNSGRCWKKPRSDEAGCIPLSLVRTRISRGDRARAMVGIPREMEDFRARVRKDRDR